MVVLQISLLGRFCIRCDDVNLSHLYSPKVQELFCYILVHWNRPHVREKLAELLWENSPPTSSKRYLRQGLWQLQSVLDKIIDANQNLLLVDTEWVQFNPAAEIWLDVYQFERAYLQAQGSQGFNLDETTAGMLAAAVDLYQGDLLENWYQDWCIYERERFQNMYLDMLLKLMSYSETRRNFEQGIAYGSAILKYDRACEISHRRLMRLRYLSGDRTGAIRQYHLCCQILKDELGVEPSGRTMAVFSQVLADKLVDVSTREPLDDPSKPHSLYDILDHLERIQRLVASLHNQVQQDIHDVMAIINGH